MLSIFENAGRQAIVAAQNPLVFGEDNHREMTRRLRRLLMDLPNTITSAVTHVRRSVRQRIAILWHFAYRVQYSLGQYRVRYGSITLSGVLLLLVSASIYLSPSFQAILEGYYTTDDGVQGLQALLLNTGAALIGAAAIVTSLVLFAMQVNIERMPHGLFRRLSADPKLLGAFAVAFLLAISVTALSTFVEQSRLAPVLLSAVWSVSLILILFMYAYRRALVLVNPLQQLQLLIHDTRRELRLWARRAQRAKPLFQDQEGARAEPRRPDSTHAVARAAYFQINHHWAAGAMRGIRHTISFARRYAEQGDYEVSAAALDAVVAINAAYIEAKGKTFYTDPLFFHDPRSRDTIINHTLECLRQNVQTGITRRDEQQIEQSLLTMAVLAQLYHGIDYSSPHAAKSHADLAAGYLANAVQTVVPHEMADVLLEGQRLMGRTAQYFLARGEVNDIATLVDKIAVIACTGCAKEDCRPVTMEGMTQLGNLTVDLLRSKSRDIRFAVDNVGRNAAAISKLFLTSPDPPLSNTHSTFLGPYYSSTSVESLRFRLATLVNAVSEEQSDNADAQAVIRNIEQWADGLHRTAKDLLLAAMGAKSSFTIAMIQWITGVTDILLAVSDAPACLSHTQKQLRKHAQWLIATLTWIPDDEESVKFVEAFQLTEALFGAAMDAHERGCDEVSEEIANYLMSWTFKGGRYINGWGVLERGLCACAALALVARDVDVEALKTAIHARVQGDGAPDQEVLEHAARGLRERAGRLWDVDRSSRIDLALSQLDHRTLAPLLDGIASILSDQSDDPSRETS